MAAPNLTDLFTRFLTERVDLHLTGAVSPADTGPGPEVVPYDGGGDQPVDAGLAWRSAAGVPRLFGAGLSADPVHAPAEWTTLVSSQPSRLTVFCASGHYPQLLRRLPPLWQAEFEADPPARPLRSADLTGWAEARLHPAVTPETLLAVGVLRLSGDLDRLNRVFGESSAVPPALRAAWDNERATTLWHAGRRDEASDLWHTQPESTPVLFNRGLAALFLGRPADAVGDLAAAADRVSASDPWHDLARLYQTLAEMRRTRAG